MGTSGGGPSSLLLSEKSLAAGFFFVAAEGLEEEEEEGPLGFEEGFVEETKGGMSLSSDESASFFAFLAFFFLDFLL